MTRVLARLTKPSRALPGLAASNGTRFDRWHWRLLACLIVCCVGFSNPGMAKSGAANGQIKPDTKNEKELAKILGVTPLTILRAERTKPSRALISYLDRALAKGQIQISEDKSRPEDPS